MFTYVSVLHHPDIRSKSTVSWRYSRLRRRVAVKLVQCHRERREVVILH